MRHFLSDKEVELPKYEKQTRTLVQGYVARGVGFPAAMQQAIIENVIALADASFVQFRSELNTKNLGLRHVMLE